MDQRTAAIDQDVKDILETRLDIAEKLELLEQRIKDTAEGATMKFSRLIDEGSQTVTQSVDRIKSALDPVHKVDDYPWLMLGGAICAGFAIGLIEARTRQRSGVYPYYPPGARASRIMPESEGQAMRDSRRADGIYDYYPDPSQKAHKADTQRGPSIWETMGRELGAETDQAKAALIQAGRSLLVEFANKLIPELARSLGVQLPSQGRPARDSYQRASYTESATAGARSSASTASRYR
jgi:hypothetical protein